MGREPSLPIVFSERELTTWSEAVLIAMIAGAMEDSLSCFPPCTSVSFFALAVFAIRKLHLSIFHSHFVFPLYFIWIWMWGLVSGGENLYPVQIEDFLRSHPAVKDVAVIGLPDKRLGEIAAAIIELKPEYELTEEEMNDFCTGLPRYKRPRKLIFADVPRNPTGKIEKPRLRSMYCGESLVAQQIEK